ncbi:MAG: ATP-binding cassette domain-containing protein [Acidobacteria bacterium]|nr:ATP-binding cassette domain-containing protein [Acidobacteriota bacterium]
MNSGIDSEIPAIEFRHVSLSFGEVRALHDVSFTLKRGQMILITGNSGSGKSVLLRLAMGLLRPDQGRVLIERREIEVLDEEEMLAIRGDLMGLVFQEDALFSGMSTYDNAAYRLVEQRRAAEVTDRAVREILRFVGLQDAMEKFPEELSGGMKRRLEIARALVGWPSIMLYDEPTAGLDPINARHILDLIIRARDLHKNSSLCVSKLLYEISYLATHYASEDARGAVRVNQADAPHGADIKVIVLDQGQIAFFGTPAEFHASDLPSVTCLTHPERQTKIP